MNKITNHDIFLSLGMAAGAAVIAGAGFLGQVVNNSQTSEGNYWDYYNRWYKFSPQLTTLIDMMLIDDPRGECDTTETISRGHVVPGPGYSKFRWVPGSWHYITFEKKKVGGSKDDTYYMAYVSPFQKATLESAMKRMFKTPAGEIRLVSVDYSSVPHLMFTDRIYNDPWGAQTTALDSIFELYDRTRSKNISVLICGPRGSGKSTIGRLLKRKFDKNDSDIMTICVENFDPSYRGCSVESLVLSNTSKYSPGILMINEIDVAMRKVFEEDNSSDHDPRVLHTKDVMSFHSFLDTIKDHKFQTNIGTTEWTIEMLYAYRAPDGRSFHSMLREGRIDLFIELTRRGCIVKTHDDIEPIKTMTRDDLLKTLSDDQKRIIHAV